METNSYKSKPTYTQTIRQNFVKTITKEASAPTAVDANISTPSRWPRTS